MPRARLVPLAAFTFVVVLAACSSSTKQSPPTSTSGTPTSTTAAPSTTSSASTTSTPTTATPTVPTTTTGAPSNVKILSLTGPPSPVTCSAPTQVQLHWTTRGAARVELRIDGGPLFSTYPDGKREPLVPLACDGKAHTYQLTARAAKGDTAVKSLTIAERRLVT